MPEEDSVELKFRIYDGSDIGPFTYSPASTVSMLKERIVSEWPKGFRKVHAKGNELHVKEKKIAPKAANDIKLICGGKFLENTKTIGQCKTPLGDLPKGVVIMHAVVQPSLTKGKSGGTWKYMSGENTALTNQKKWAKVVTYTHVPAGKKIDEGPKKSICACSIM